MLLKNIIKVREIWQTLQVFVSKNFSKFNFKDKTENKEKNDN